MALEKQQLPFKGALHSSHKLSKYFFLTMLAICALENDKFQPWLSKQIPEV